MHLATPIWLLALIPWAGLAIWMLWGRRARIGVPFLALWRNGDARPSTRRAVQAPPLAIVLLLLAILFAIVAATSPVLSSGKPDQSVTVLVDRGISMSARDGKAYRYERAAALLATHASGPVRVIAVPSRDVQPTDAAGLVGAVQSLPPTAVDTSADIAQGAMRLLATTDHPVIVLTDQAIANTDPRLVVVAPPAGQTNAGITHVAARDKPAAQVMVRVHADSPSKVTVVISTDGRRVERTVDAPTTALIDMPRLGKTIEVALARGDALTADDRAWLVRETDWPRVEPIATLGAELVRMVEAYGKLRAPGDGGRVVSITDAVDAVSNTANEAVILAPATAAGSGAVSVVDHPVTAHMDWDEVLTGARLGDAAPAGFTPVVSLGDSVAVAVRDTPRQVWIAMDAPALARRADYVVFWTNTFDWLGQGGDTFVDHPIGLLGDVWRRVTDGPPGTAPGLWPGVYERGDGTLRAVNAGAHVKPSVPAIEQDWQQRLARLTSSGGGGHSLPPYLLLLALACALGAALRWPGRRAKPRAGEEPQRQ